MDVNLTQSAIAMLNVLFNEPKRLYPESVPSPMGGVPLLVPYKAPDTVAALEMVSIVRWMENKVMTKQPDGRFKLPPEGWKGSISKTAYRRIKEIIKYYETWGFLAPNCVAYMDLVYGMDGKLIDSDLLDVEKDT